VLQYGAVWCNVLQFVALCDEEVGLNGCNVVQCGAVCCSAMQFVAMCCCVLQCVLLRCIPASRCFVAIFSTLPKLLVVFQQKRHVCVGLF